MAKRVKTQYPGVYYRLGKRLGRGGTEKIYYIVFKKQGLVHEEKAGRQYADHMSAQRAAGIRAERLEGKRPSPKEIREQRKSKKDPWTLQRLWDEYKRQRPELKALGPDENRFKKYLKPAFGKKEPQEIYPLDVERFRINKLKGKSPQTVKLTLALLRRICNFGYNKRLCKPLSFQIQMPKVHNEKTEDLTAAQLKALFEAIEKESHLQAGHMMKMVLFTGMRRGEMFKLKWRDIDFERGFITIRNPKGGPDQKIPLNEETRELLDSIVRTKSPYVFYGRAGGLRTDISHQVNRIKKAAGLPEDFRPLHGLRHTYASMLASSGKVDMYTLQNLLTHKDPKMTMRYAHLRDQALKRAADTAGDLMREAVSIKREEKVVHLDQKNEKK